MSSDPADTHIVLLRRDQLRAVGEVLSQSHAEYPAFRHKFPDPGRRQRALRRMFSGIARDALRFRSVYPAETTDGKAVAIWLPPGHAYIPPAATGSTLRRRATGRGRGSAHRASSRRGPG
jgi:hypothetical protein